MFALAMSSAAREGETGAHARMQAPVPLFLAIGRSPRVRRSEAESNAHCGQNSASPSARQVQGEARTPAEPYVPQQKSGPFLAALFTLDYTPFKGVTT